MRRALKSNLLRARKAAAMPADESPQKPVDTLETIAGRRTYEPSGGRGLQGHVDRI